MEKDLTLRPDIELGFLPTHAGFIRALIPGEDGALPQAADGKRVVVEAVREVLERSRVEVPAVQIPLFQGATEAEWDAMIKDLRELGIRVHLVVMLGEVDPMEPADEDATVAQLVTAFEAAKRNGVEDLSATSVEQWMQPGASRKEGGDFQAAIEQLVRVHLRAYREAGVAGSCVEAMHLEFLRPGEFQTFTDLGRMWQFVKAANEALGTPFFKCLVDAAHCGDSALEIPDCRELIGEIAAGGGLGMFHASAKTTRGCLTSDDGWVAALLESAARSGELRQVFVEMFDHAEEALEPLRVLDPGYGVDTRDGRDDTQVVVDGLALVTRILNQYVVRGILKA